MPPEEHNARRFSKVAIAVASMFASALIGGLVSRYLDRARPSVELAAIEIAGTASPDTRVPMTAALRQVYRNLPFDYKELKGPYLTFEDARAVLAENDDSITVLSDSASALTQIIQLLETRRTDYPNEQLRPQLLEIYSQPRGTALESIMQATLIKRGWATKFSTDSTFERYRSHPPEWKDPSIAVLSIRVGATFDLSELLHDDDDDPSTRRAKTIANYTRRLWIYLDRDLLVQILRQCEEELDLTQKLAVSFRQELEAEVLKINPERVHAAVVVTNLGSDSVLFDRTALLSLVTGRGPLPIEMRPRDTPENTIGPIVVEGKSGTIINFVSAQTLEILDSSVFGADRKLPPGVSSLRTLYGTETLDVDLAMAQITGTGKREILRLGGSQVFGKSVKDALAKRLREAVGGRRTTSTP